MDSNEARRVQRAANRAGYGVVRVRRDPAGDGYITSGLRDGADTRDRWHSMAEFRAAGGVPAPRTGRPATGTGGRGAVVLAQHGHGSVKLILGKEIWRALGSPRRVALSATRRGVCVRATADDGPGTWSLGGARNTAPACNIGRAVATGLGLLPGRYRATADGAAIRLTPTTAPGTA